MRSIWGWPPDSIFSDEDGNSFAPTLRSVLELSRSYARRTIHCGASEGYKTCNSVTTCRVRYEKYRIDRKSACGQVASK